MQVQTSETQVIELDYPAVRVGKNLAGRFFDLFTFVIIGFILLIPTLFLIQGNREYQSWITKQDEIRLESQLYKKNKEGKIVVLGSYYDEEDELTFNEKSAAIEEALTFFFSDYVNEELVGEGKKTYLTYKLDQKNKDGVNLFSEEGKRVFLSSDYDSLYYSSYCSLVKNQATGYLNLKGEYLSLKKKTSLTYLIGIPLTFVISYCIVYYIIPLCLSRGKQTLGMKMTKTALLAVDGFSCGAGRFTLRFLFKLFIILIGSFAALFIPLAVSVTMIVLMKSHQSLSEYVTNTYLVSIEDRSVYRNLSEYRISNQAIEKNNYMEKL